MKMSEWKERIAEMDEMRIEDMIFHLDNLEKWSLFKKEFGDKTDLFWISSLLKDELRFRQRVIKK